MVTSAPNITIPRAGNFSRLQIELGSSWIYAKPGSMYANGMAAINPWNHTQNKN